MNADGLVDLYIYDRLGHAHIPLLRNQDNSYTKKKEWVKNFPAVYHWSKLVDINGDNIPDLLSGSDTPFLDECLFFVGHLNSGQLQFQPFQNALGDHYLTYLDQGIEKAILINTLDMPAISDIDGDGDMDILTFNALGDYVLYYKNICIDSNRTLSSPLFVLEDQCWGKFHEDGSGQGVTFSTSPTDCALGLMNPPSESSIHNGATLTALDIDLDGDKDLLFGDPSSLYLHLLYNWGDSNQAWIRDEEPNFPNQNDAIPWRYLPYAQPFDSNEDSLTNILITPYQTSGIDRNVIQAWVNEGNNHWSLDRAFFLNHILDHGSFSHPAPFDYNGDGWLDIVLGIGHVFDAHNRDESRLILYENLKTEIPSFRLIDTNWLELSRFNINDVALSPAFADLNNDQKTDMVLGGASGKVYALFNSAKGNDIYNFDSVIKNWMDIDVDPPLGSYTAPFLHDLNEDGLVDLLIGHFTGKLSLLLNDGESTSPLFHSNPSSEYHISDFGGLNVSQPGNTNGNAAPFIYQWKGKSYLLIGSEYGELHHYHLQLNNEKVESIFDHTYSLKIGSRIKPCIADFNNDGQPELIVGNARGGINTYELEPTSSDKSPTFDSEIFVNNPVLNDVLYLKNHQNCEYAVINLQGKVLIKGHIDFQNEIDVSTLVNGTYLLHLRSSDLRVTKKFVKL